MQCNHISHFPNATSRPQSREQKGIIYMSRGAHGQKQKFYLSFSTTLMTDMLKVISQATKLMISTPPRAFCL